MHLSQSKLSAAILMALSLNASVGYGATTGPAGAKRAMGRPVHRAKLPHRTNID